MTRRPIASFRVIPATPNYLLRYPNSHDASFPDVLRVYNGFEPGRGWMDLRPDMELRIENAYYRPGMPRRGLDGFLGTEIAQFEVRHNGELELVSTQSMKDRPQQQLPVQELVQSWQRHYRFHRFYNEILFKRVGESRGSVLLGAHSSSDLDQLINQLQNNPDSVCNDRSINCTVFPEACSVSIEMRITVNGTPRTVLWGSVVASVVEHPQRIDLYRVYNGRLTPVNLDSLDVEALRLPLLPGDHLTWR